ncbi:hypothetical protein FPZ43_15720 [Mucilaginibacter pallidiroseus]|uniref:Uncharacterized protein n=1 Tax=Mucilaginibacter pallidiroseus TaxID=2599295 RepID=A0A563U329_9SPHI|nr:hypothetical protein [Mucilaginibacter pallidiroseus]TWR25733.1 hypothetical protein FPZ43_15720 [Mucilaginibacter pallidiroseus]
MPAAEQSFLRELVKTDSVYDAQINEITKKESFEKGKAEVEKYIINNLSVNNWVGIVQNIEVKSEPVDYVKVDVFLPIGNWHEAAGPEYTNPMFVSLVNPKDAKLMEAVKKLQKGDEVFVSGNIQKNLSGRINFINYTDGIRDLESFKSLNLDLKLTDIKKSNGIKP